MSAADDDLIRAHADLVYATCLRLTGNPQDASDVCQEVFIAWMRQRGQIRGPLAAWLHGTARRRSLDWLRRQHRRSYHERQVDEPRLACETAAGEPADGAWRGHLDGCLAELDDRQRTLVLEHHVLGVTQEALAVRWRLSQATISRHLAQGLSRLRRGLARHGVTAVTLTALPGLLASRTSAAECPSDLWSPLAAHLRINGSSSLAGKATLSCWWVAWPTLVAASFVGLMVLAAATLLMVRAVIAADVPADPLPALVARLPPSLREVEFPHGPGTHRYLSVEALIARLPAVEEARQARIRRWLTSDGTSKPWAWLAIDKNLIEPTSSSRFIAASKPSPAVMAADLLLLQELERLLPDLEAPGTLTPAGWLAADYRDGRFQRAGDLMEACAPFQTEPRYLLRALGRQADTAADPHAVLVKIDAFTAALNRGSYTVLASMLALAYDSIRDDIYLRLALQGRLSATDLTRWCKELQPAVETVSDGLLGEMLLVLIPRQEDVMRWGGAAMNEDFVSQSAPTPGIMDWLVRPAHMRMFGVWTHSAARIRATLHGVVENTPIGSEMPGLPAFDALVTPGLLNMAGSAATARLNHNGRRLMAWLVASSRQGVPLPKTLNEVVQAVADGPSLVGGTSEMYGLRYQLLSDTRFRLELDPSSQVPSYADAQEMQKLVGRSLSRKATVGKAPPTVVTNTSWEADIDRLNEPAAVFVEDEPVAPSANQ